MRYVRYLVLGVIAIVLITVAVANRGPLTLRLLPAELEGKERERLEREFKKTAPRQEKGDDVLALLESR